MGPLHLYEADRWVVTACGGWGDAQRAATQHRIRRGHVEQDGRRVGRVEWGIIFKEQDRERK